MVLVFLVLLAFFTFGILQELEPAAEPREAAAGSCPQCDQQLEAAWLLCPRCQLPLRESCGGCTKLMPVYHRHCTHCGHHKEGR